MAKHRPEARLVVHLLPVHGIGASQLGEGSMDILGDVPTWIAKVHPASSPLRRPCSATLAATGPDLPGRIDAPAEGFVGAPRLRWRSACTATPALLTALEARGY